MSYFRKIWLKMIGRFEDDLADILGGFHKMIDRLEAHAEQQDFKVAELEVEIREKTAAQEQAAQASARAATTARNIKFLVNAA